MEQRLLGHTNAGPRVCLTGFSSGVIGLDASRAKP